jgi:hypothetical protein
VKFLGYRIRTESAAYLGSPTGYTYHIVSYEGTSEELQEVWDFIVRQGKGFAFRWPMENKKGWTINDTMDFTIGDKGVAAMVRLAFP